MPDVGSRSHLVETCRWEVTGCSYRLYGRSVVNFLLLLPDAFTSEATQPPHFHFRKGSKEEEIHNVHTASKGL